MCDKCVYLHEYDVKSQELMPVFGCVQLKLPNFAVA